MSYCQAALGACCHPSCACGVHVARRAPQPCQSPGEERLIEVMKAAFEESMPMTPEQEQLQADLIAQYGEPIVRQARELSGLTMCMLALGTDTLSSEERERAYQQASLHLAQLVDTMMSPEHSAKVAECAKRIDVALDTWMADEIEKRDGLPSG